jgi:electron transfer flavoprotein beta subunit
MPEMRIVVCMKVVPKAEEIRVDPKTHRIERAGVRSEFNPPDMNALEMALTIKDTFGGSITILSMGPPSFEPYLRIGLAMGADSAILLTDRDFAGADTLATTYTLARGVEKAGGADLIICGEESADGATGQVPSGLAEWLDYPQITLVTEIEVDQKRRTVQGRREIRGGYELHEVPLPTVLSVKTASNEPRFMDYERKSWAFDEAEIAIWDQGEIDAEKEFIGIPGSPTVVSGLKQAETPERKRAFLQGTPEEMAAQLVNLIGEKLDLQ